MDYIPRLKSPDISNKYYTDKSNPFVLAGGSMFTVFGNAGLYAWGRFYEIMTTIPKLYSSNSLDKWYGHSGDGYSKGAEPQLGAVACWVNVKKSGGHVAIVEKINKDGSITLSESASGATFRTRTAKKPNYNTSDYVFQGFIYNPAVQLMNDKCKEFLYWANKAAIDRWTKTTIKSILGYVSDSWCANFVCAVAKKAGILGKVIYESAGAGYVSWNGYKANMGQWLPGPFWPKGSVVTPHPGDLMLWSYSGATNYWNAAHIGIVYSVTSGGVIKSIEGNIRPYTYAKYRDHKLKITSTEISGFFRPYWHIVGSSTANIIQDEITEDNTEIFGSLYDTEYEREDALMREVGYLNSQGEPSIKSSDVRLSVVNYTSLLGAIFNGNYNQIVSETILDRLDNTSKAIFKTLNDFGFNSAACIGIIANMYYESGLKTNAVGDNNTSFGICQWHDKRGQAMKKFVGADWRTNLTGQLNYLKSELIQTYPKLFKSLKSILNNEAGAREASDLFVRQFEVPADIDAQSKKRQEKASQLWGQITNQLRRGN